MTWKSRPRCTRHHGLDFGNRSRDRSPRDATVGGDDEVILETDAPHGSTRIDPIFNKVKSIKYQDLIFNKVKSIKYQE